MRRDLCAASLLDFAGLHDFPNRFDELSRRRLDCTFGRFNILCAFIITNCARVDEIVASLVVLSCRDLVQQLENRRSIISSERDLFVSHGA